MDIDNMLADHASSAWIITACQYISKSRFHAGLNDINNRVVSQKIE